MIRKDVDGMLYWSQQIDKLYNSSHNIVKTPINELCKQALEHYLKLSDEACHYNSLIPEAIELYRKTCVEKCDNCKWNKLPNDCKLGREPETNMPICSSFNSVYDSSDEHTKNVNKEIK